MVVDYRALNKLTVENRHPLPRIDDLFDQLHGAKYFSGLDAASGFHQILLKLKTAPATFQAVMNRLFNPAHFTEAGAASTGHKLSDFVLVFVDDILVFSKTAAEHKRHLEIVFELLRKEKLQIKASRCLRSLPIFMQPLVLQQLRDLRSIDTFVSTEGTYTIQYAYINRLTCNLQHCRTVRAGMCIESSNSTGLVSKPMHLSDSSLSMGLALELKLPCITVDLNESHQCTRVRSQTQALQSFLQG